MDALHLFGTIIRILNQPVFPPRRKASQAKTYVASLPGPVPAAAPVVRSPASSAAAALSTPAPIVTTQAMRTLEEVRADLAKLRAHSKRRHLANVQARRDIGFAPTDFMDFGASPAPRAAAPSGFAPTDFLDMHAIKLP